MLAYIQSTSQCCLWPFLTNISGTTMPDWRTLHLSPQKLKQNSYLPLFVREALQLRRVHGWTNHRHQLPSWVSQRQLTSKSDPRKPEGAQSYANCTPMSPTLSWGRRERNEHQWDKFTMWLHVSLYSAPNRAVSGTHVTSVAIFHCSMICLCWFSNWNIYRQTQLFYNIIAKNILIKLMFSSRKFQALEDTQRDSLENEFLPGFPNIDTFSNISNFY